MEAAECMGPTQSLMRPSQDAVTTFDYNVLGSTHQLKQVIKLDEPFRGATTRALLQPWNAPVVLT
jgi:hypothetical protein